MAVDRRIGGNTICPIYAHLPAPMNTVCKHPRVRVVAREDDVEFVECLDCGDVFDSNEFRDMAIEEMQDEEEETA
jgi:Zn ribbon nucleic-acid-binding protein